VRTRRISSVPQIPTATASPQVLLTQVPAAEPTPFLTETQLPILSPTPTGQAEIVLGDTQTVPDGGFSFRPVLGYDVNILPGQATLVSQDGRFIFSLAGGKSLSGTPLNNILGRLLDNVSKEMDSFQAGEPYPILVGESQGLAADVIGKMAESPINGQVAVVAPNASQVFYVLAFAVNPVDQNLWESSGEEVFTAVVGSVAFFEPSD
jgi:hypothetical protein